MAQKANRVLQTGGLKYFRQLLVFGAAFHGSLQLASSYFPYFFTKELQIPMRSVILWTGLANVGCFISARFWGSHTDRTSSLFRILWWTGHGVAFAPMVYVLGNRSSIQIIAPFEYLINGLVWSGFILAQAKLLMKTSRPGRAAAYFSVYGAGIGISGALATFLGGQLANLLLPIGGFRALWVIATASRLAVLWILCRPLLDTQADSLQLPSRYLWDLIRRFGALKLSRLSKS